MRAEPSSTRAGAKTGALLVVPAHGSETQVLPFSALWSAADNDAPYAGRRATLLALFENRVTWSTIRHWQTGRRTMPDWARDILRAELKRQIAERQHVLDILDGR